MEDEITRLRYMLQDNVGENEIVGGLQKELGIKENQMKLRDDEITDLIEERNRIEQEKIQMEKEMEAVKTKQLLMRTKTMKKPSDAVIPAADRSVLDSARGSESDYTGT